MVKKIVWIIILLAALGTGVYFIFFNGKNDSATTENTDTSNTQSEDTSESEDNTENSESEDTTETEDLTGFSTDSQTVGAESTSKYTIESIANSSKSEYHEFQFTLSSDGTDDPYVTATYNSALGVIRVDLNQIEDDNSGIAYQSSAAINQSGVIRLYHNVSNDETEELYDVGVSAETPFKLTLSEATDGWVVTLDVQYPGDSTDSDIDYGSTEFSKVLQSITGVDTDSGATVYSYTYGSSSGVVKFVWNVKSDVTNPIPSVTAQYDSSNNLVVTFASLKSDRVYSAVNDLSLPGGLKLETTRSGSASTYTVTGMSSTLDFKLSAGTSPNQVTLEIEL